MVWHLGGQEITFLSSFVSTLLIGSGLVVDGQYHFRENYACRSELQEQQYRSFGEREAAVTNRQKAIAISVWILP